MTFLTTSINQCPKECRLNVHIFFAIRLIRMNSKKKRIIKYNVKIQPGTCHAIAMLSHILVNMNLNLMDKTLEVGTDLI